MSVLNTAANSGTSGLPHIHFIRSQAGTGTPMVLLHALGLDLGVWEHQFAEFGRDHDLLAIDLPGHGGSAALAAPFDFAQMAEVVVAVLDRLQIAQAHLVGISVGGMIAQTLAIMRPERVKALSLIATSCTFAAPVRQVLLERARTVREGGMQAIAPLHLARWFAPDFHVRRPDVIDRLGKTLLRQDSEYHARMWEMVAQLDIGAQLARVCCPTMIVAGADDLSASPAAAQLMTDHLGHRAQVGQHLMPACGHFPPLEYPVQFNALLADFLAAID